MHRSLLAATALLASLASPAVAELDGAALYAQYCGACHGNDGVGPEGNVNPPLAKSEWLLGEPDRAIAAVLKGLVGPIEVRGKLYNLAMPPQGAVLDDAQLAAIISHVRTSFGNVRDNAKPADIAKRHVTAETVAAVRAKYADRQVPFNSNELRQTYPIPFSQGWPRLQKLTSTIYEGKWEVMPDFSTLEPIAVEEERRNLVDVAHAEPDKEFGIVWEGEVVTRKEGDYNAILSAKDGARLYIDGKLIVEVEGIGELNEERTRRKRFRMPQGASKFRLEYFNNQGDPGIVLRWTGPTGSPYASESRLDLKHSPPPVVLEPNNGRPAIYRNFIEGARPKAIGVGYGEVNQAFSIAHLGLDLVWKGAFIDAGRHWTNRGQGYQKPAGEAVVHLLSGPAFGILSDEKSAWPKRGEEPYESDFTGYNLDPQGLPTFRYDVSGISFEEKVTPDSGKGGFTRTITYTAGDEAPQDLHLCLVSRSPFALASETGNAATIADILDLKVTAGPALKVLPGKAPHLLLPLVTESGTHTITLDYLWK